MFSYGDHLAPNLKHCVGCQLRVSQVPDAIASCTTTTTLSLSLSPVVTVNVAPNLKHCVGCQLRVSQVPDAIASCTTLSLSLSSCHGQC